MYGIEKYLKLYNKKEAKILSLFFSLNHLSYYIYFLYLILFYFSSTIIFLSNIFSGYVLVFIWKNKIISKFVTTNTPVKTAT